MALGRFPHTQFGILPESAFGCRLPANIHSPFFYEYLKIFKLIPLVDFFRYLVTMYVVMIDLLLLPLISFELLIRYGLCKSSVNFVVKPHILLLCLFESSCELSLNSRIGCFLVVTFLHKQFSDMNVYHNLIDYQIQRIKMRSDYSRDRF